jgi:hypothetical protein
LTFDDGWIDFTRMPIRPEIACSAGHGLPATDFIETGRRMWPDRVFGYIKRETFSSETGRQGDSSDPIVNRLEDIRVRPDNSRKPIGLLKITD